MKEQKNYKILYTYFLNGGGELILPNVKTDPVPYHNFLLLLKGHNFPILCGYLLPVTNIEINNCWETHISELEKRYRNKGYGKLMYQYMFNFGRTKNMTIINSKHTSKSAKRVWTSLEKCGMVIYDNKLDRFKVENNK